MTVNDLGYNENTENHRIDHNLELSGIGRIVSEHKDRYIIKTHKNEINAELIGNLRFTANTRYDLPAVGDWVSFSEYDEGKGLIHSIFPRSSIIERKAVGKSGQVQIIATNIDYGLIVQAVDRDFNLNRLERYLIICNASKVAPIIVLSKIDLISELKLETILNQIQSRISNVPIITVSNQTIGYDKLNTEIQKGKTYCLLGSSGVGKSTILNNLSGKQQMKTGEISSSVNKGRHITSHRELIIIEGGGIIIDNPGMREVGITDTTEGLEITFDEIFEFAKDCRYKDCTHSHELGCAVKTALENGEIDEGVYSNFKKIEKEEMHFEADALERKKKDKNLGKLIKNMKKQKKKNKN